MQQKIARAGVVLTALGMSLALTTAAGVENSEDLLNLLVKKGILTQDEVLELREEAAEEEKSRLRWKLHSSLDQIELFGDARLRFEHRSGEDLMGDRLERDRFRYRLRFGFKGDFKEDFYYGVRLETSASPRSTNITFGDDPGPSGKNSDGIFVGRLYLGWKPTDWLQVEGGRMANPLVTTSMVWDGDINPEGLSQRFRHSFGSLDLFATLGQFIYDDANPNNPLGIGGYQNNAFLLAWQGGARYKFNDSLSAQLAPTLYTYTGTGDSFRGPYDPASATSANLSPQRAINDLLVVEVPAEVNFNIGKYPAKLFADVAVNVQGRDRAAAARRANSTAYPGRGSENLAYQIGASIGRAARKGTWGVRGFWQRAELFSLDPNLVDSDVFDSILNMEGLAIAAGYAITDNITANVTYAQGSRINKNLPTGRGGDIGGVGAALNDYRLLQLDLNWKF